MDAIVTDRICTRVFDIGGTDELVREILEVLGGFEFVNLTVTWQTYQAQLTCHLDPGIYDNVFKTKSKLQTTPRQRSNKKDNIPN